MEDGRLLILLNLGEEYMGDLHSFLSTLTCLKVPIIKSRTKRKEKKQRCLWYFLKLLGLTLAILSQEVLNGSSLSSYLEDPQEFLMYTQY